MMHSLGPVRQRILFSVVVFIAFSSCNNNKSAPNDKEKNPFASATNSESQILKPCHWSFAVEQSGSGEAILISTAKLDSRWHLYSQHIPDKRVASEFSYDKLGQYRLVGDTWEEEPNKEYDPYLEIEVLYFEREAVFRQRIEVLSKDDFTITGTIDHMVCLTQCVNSDEEFSFEMKGNPEGK